MDKKDTLFFAEMYSLVRKMEDTIDEFDMKDRTIASIVIGLIDLDSVEEGDSDAQMKTMYSFNLQSREELEAVKDVMDSTYKEDDDEIDLDDLLGGLGISLN
jgi:Zn-dependent M16 (insulinase) family peptidase